MDTRRIAVLCGLLTWATLPTTGCRTPWSAPLENPSFDRLIEAERAGQYMSSADRRPRSTNLRDDEYQRDSGDITPTRHISSQTDDAAVNLAAATSELGPKYAALLERQMTAVRDRLHSGGEPTETLAGDESSEPVMMSFSDMEPETTTPASTPPNTPAAMPNASRPTSSQLGRTEISQVNLASATTPGPANSPPAASTAQVAATQTSANTAIDPPLTQDVVQQLASESDATNWQELIRQASIRIDAAASQASSPEQKIELAKARRLLSLSMGDLTGAMEPIEGVDQNLKQYLQLSMQALHDVTDPNGHPHSEKRSTLALKSQRAALRHLAAASDLAITGAAFCIEVESYGDVKQFEKYSFRAGQEVLLYCEVDNFVSPKMPDGINFETHLRGSYKIVNTQGFPVDEQSLPANSEASRIPRRDYFMVYRVWLPQNIATGNYQLKLAIEDVNGRKFGHAGLDFEVIQ